MKYWFLLSLIFFCYTQVMCQDIRYDTTYQVTYENGIKDSVIVIYKRVIVNEKFYIVDSTQKYRWALDAHVDPFITASRLKSYHFTSPEINNHNKEVKYTGQSIGFNFYSTGKMIDIRVGLNFSRYTISLKSSRNVFTQTTTKYLENDTLDTYYTVDDNGQITYFYIIEPQEKTRIDTKTEFQNNSAIGKFYYTQIVLQGAYKRTIKNWDLLLFAGPVADILITSRGNILNEKGDKVSSREVSINKPTINFQANLQTCYHLSPRIQLFVEPYFQKFLFSFNKEQYALYPRNFIGLKSGLKFSL
ncbi:MAG: hypothetical protein J7604_24600 [Sporocytophaga sp.]|uniref:hypothetical protein n=1 Tax=Sporocytophaga sp. TaxID=2231183 RepID=UPI001B16594A|nr:hypothetical protein [Sporocytophaga sp.]MBO9703412.1 hypothetical protein [Sporocytophaga sp.]